MPEATCPIFSHPAYRYAESKLGPDKALEIYDAIKTTVIPKAMVDAYVAQRDAEKQILVPNDIKRKAYVGGKDNNGIPFDRINNDRSWKVELDSGLVKKFTTDEKGKRTPDRQYFGMRQATAKIPILAKEFPGFIFAPKEELVNGNKKIRIVVSDLTFPVWAKNHPNMSDETQQLKPSLLNKQQVIESVLSNINESDRELIRGDLQRMDKDEFNVNVAKAGYNSLGNYWTQSSVQDLKQDVTEQPKQEINKELEARVAILQKAIPWKVDVKYDDTIPEIARLEPGGRVIVLNPRLMTTDAIGHEFGHILINLIGGMSNPLVRQGREQLKGSPVESAVLLKYPELAGDTRLDEEVITTSLGVEVASIFAEQEQQNKFMRWLVRFFRAIKSKLGIEQSAVRQLAERLVAGRELTGKDSVSVKERQKGLYIAGEASIYTQYSKDLTNTTKVMETLIEKEKKYLADSIKVVNRKIAVYESRDSDAVELEELKKVREYMERSTPTYGMIQMIKYAATSTNRMNGIYATYIRDKDKGRNQSKIDAELLGRWLTHVSAFDILDGFKQLFVDARNQLHIIGSEEEKTAARVLLYQNQDIILSMFSDEKLKGEKKSKREKMADLIKSKKVNILDVLLPELTRILEIKETIKKLYDDKGKEIMIDLLAPLTGKVLGEAREKWEGEWNALKDKPMTLVAYLEQKQLENNDTIIKETRELVAIELERASGDISYWRRYADPILDSPDVISSAIAKMFFKLQEKTRRETLDWKYMFADRIEALEKVMPRPLGMSDEDYFDMFIETDPVTGERTDYLVGEVPTKLVNDYLLHRTRIRSPHYRKANGHKIGTEVDIYLEENLWKDKYAPRRKNEWLKAQADFVQKMKEDGLITSKELKDFLNTYKITSKQSKVKPKDIFDNPDAVNAFYGFTNKNNWTYRDVHPKYKDVNSKWLALEQMRAAGLRDGVQTDERIKYYDFLIEASNAAENNVPIGSRLGMKIPSMHKEFGQKLRSGESTYSILKEEIGERLQLQKFDTDRGELGTDKDTGLPKKGRTQLVNEANEPVYFVPLYYINDIGEVTYVLDDNTYKRLRDHEVPEETITKLKTIKGKTFDTEQHFRDFLEKADPTVEITPLTIEETSLYMEYIVHDARKRDLKVKSFDLTSTYYNYLKMSIDFRNKSEIQHEAEMARYFVNNRTVIQRDGQGNIVLDALTTKLKNVTGGAKENARVDPGNRSNISYQFDSFYKAQLYGMQSEEEPDLNFLGYKLNRAKLLDAVSGYTALSLLGVNFVAGFANVALGEITQGIEAWANEVFGAKDMTKATGIYYKELGNTVGDIGARKPSSLIGLLNELYDTLHEFDSEGNMIYGNRFANLMQMNTLFFTSHVGEHYMQTRAMLAMLNHIRAKNDKGEDIGSILDNYSVDEETGRLKFNPEVKNWDENARDDFSARMHRALARMHGEYSSIGKSEMQQQALGRMAIMFRRFVIPGFKRRWEAKQWNNLYGDFTEGNYRTFGRFAKQLMTDLVKFKTDLIKEDWNRLSAREKANIYRTLGEISAFLAAGALAALALKAKEDDDKDNWALNMLAYQALRLKSELSFFINPAATLQILRSPMASISFAQSLIELVDRGIFYPVTNGFQFEVYKAGTWKDHYKIEKTLTGMFPIYKQYYRVMDIKDQLSWFNR